jgi:hypothetical protein
MGAGLAKDWAPTERACARCEKGLLYTEDLYLVELVQPHAGTARAPDCLAVRQDDGDYLCEPRLFHVACWEEMLESLREELEDTPPCADRESAFRCMVCESGIRAWEEVASVSFGELHVSKRAPHHTHEPAFARGGSPDLLCLHCAWLVGEHWCHLWKAIEDACAECLHRRCDRQPRCVCRCHAK